MARQPIMHCLEQSPITRGISLWLAYKLSTDNDSKIGKLRTTAKY